MTTTTRPGRRPRPASTPTPSDVARACRHAASVVLVVLGAYLLALPFALSLFTRTDDAEKLADRYRSFGTEEGLAQFSEHTDIVVRGGEQLLDDALPRLRRRPRDERRRVRRVREPHFPNIAMYRERAPEVFAYLAPAVAPSPAQADNVDDADDFPVAGRARDGRTVGTARRRPRARWPRSVVVPAPRRTAAIAGARRGRRPRRRAARADLAAQGRRRRGRRRGGPRRVHARGRRAPRPPTPT